MTDQQLTPQWHRQWLHATASPVGSGWVFVEPSIAGPGDLAEPPGWFSEGDDDRIRLEVAEVISERVGRPVDPKTLFIDYVVDDEP